MEQEHVIVHILLRLKLGILCHKPRKGLLASWQVVQFVLEDDTGMQQSVFDNLVAGSHLFLGEWYLRQVVFTLVRVVDGRVHLLLKLGLLFLHLGNGVLLLLCQLRQFLCRACSRHYRLIVSLPVVHVLTLAPQPLEGLLTLRHRLLTVEVPYRGARLLCRCGRGGGLVRRQR